VLAGGWLDELDNIHYAGQPSWRLYCRKSGVFLDEAGLMCEECFLGYQGLGWVMRFVGRQ
jgi:hypothetical protein